MSIPVSKYMFVIIPLACALALAVTEPLWVGLEFKAYDAKVNLCRSLGIDERRPSGKVVIVAIEELAALKRKPFIFWYPDLGRFLDISARSGATAVGLDMIPFHSLEQKLAGSFDGMGGDIPAPAVLDDIGRQLDDALVSAMMKASRDMTVVQGVAGELVPFYYDLMAFMENVKPASLRVEADHDGILRSEFRTLEKEQEGFVSQLLIASGSEVANPERFKVNFGLLGSIPVIPFDEVLGETFDRGKLKGKIIILGMQSKHEDVHDTPLGNQPGALIHATALETLLTQTAPVTPGRAIRVVILALLCFAAFPFTRFRQPFHSFCWITVLMLAYAAGCILAFPHGHDMPVFPNIVAPLLIFTACYLYRYMVEERTRRQLYQTFSYYVDPMVIDQLITQDPEKLMKGEQRDVCVMFLDIRGFTALSEKISSEALVSMLNVFFGRVSEQVQGNSGFVNKFIGDGMLAFFAIGERYVDDALRASRDICRITEELNDSGTLTPFIGGHRIGIGIGLHCGQVVLGNIGSKRKLDFTVIGPPVNTASRIESLTKQFSRKVLVSSAVRSAAGDEFPFEALGRAEVKGIEGGVEVFSLTM